MSVFEYLGVLLSVVMGLGVTHLLAGLSKTIHHRKTVKHYWVHTLWTFNILIYIVIIWWGMFWWSGLEEWSLFRFSLLILYAILVFLTASLLFPWDLPNDFDFERHFSETRPWFFSILMCAWLVDIPETVIKSGSGLRDLPEAYIVAVGVHLLLSMLAVLWSNAAYHRFFAIFWPLWTVAYLSFTTLSEIAV